MRCICIQITRGLAVAESILSVSEKCYRMAWIYHLVSGLPLIAAKNAAVDRTLAHYGTAAHKLFSHFLLVEDDILLTDEVEDALNMDNSTAAYARARQRGGTDNVILNHDGQFLATGTCFTVVPLWALYAMRQAGPIFEAYEWHLNPDGRELRRGSPSRTGRGSDTGFWYKLRHLPHPPRIVELGRVRHIKHCLNERQNNLDPCELSEW